MTVVAAPAPALTAQRPGRPAERRRLALALGVSLAAHAGLLAGPAALPRSAVPLPFAISVRIEAAAKDEIPAPPSGLDSNPEPARRPSAEPSPSLSRPASGAAPLPALQAAPTMVMPPPIHDPTYYPARDLDVYPRLAAPLRLDVLERRGLPREGARIVFQLLIDEHGIVREATLVEAAPRGELEEAARAELASARFLPAMRNDRPVRSRVMLGIEPGVPRE